MVHTDVGLRIIPKLVSLNDKRVIEFCMDGSWLPYVRMTDVDGCVAEVYLKDIEAYNELWGSLLDIGFNNINRRVVKTKDV